MTRQDINQQLLQTSFLYGANSAYIEAMQAKYEKDPYSIEAGWREFFDALGDDPASVGKTAQGASWERPNWPVTPKDELTNALDGDWPATEKAIADKLRGRAAAAPEAPQSDDAIHRATRDSVRALMMIRAYRMRGHLHANLDPLGLEPQKDHEELHPATYGFLESDWDRKIFIDHVLGLEYATVREMLAILRRTYCGTIGFEFIHISVELASPLVPAASAEIVLHVHRTRLAARCEAANVHEAIDGVIDKADEQVRRFRDRVTDRKGRIRANAEPPRP